MSEKKLNIPFKIIQVVEDQFSLFEETLEIDAPLKQKIGFGFGADIESTSIAVTMEFILQKNELPLLKQEITCYFEIEATSFEKKIKQVEQLVLPCNFAKHLAMITIGTARGVLFANTKNTEFNQFLIGLLNVDRMFNEDIAIKF